MASHAFSSMSEEDQLTPTVSAALAAGVTSLTSGSNLLVVTAPATIIQTGGSSTIVSPISPITVEASGGSGVVFAGTAAASVSTSGDTSLTFVGGTAVDSLYALGSADTVYSGSAGLAYQGGTGSDLFVAGPGSNVTLTGAAQETIYANTGSGSWNLSNTSQAYFGGGGGADSVTFGNTSATLWGNTNENFVVLPSTGTQSVHAVAFGDNDDLNLFSTSGHDSVVIWNANIGTGGTPVDFTGNTTLTASNAGNELVAMFAGAQFGTPAEAAHTITIFNWQATDTFDLSYAQDASGNYLAGYTAADAASATAQLASGNAFTLSDGTKVVFAGTAKPMTIEHV